MILFLFSLFFETCILHACPCCMTILYLHRKRLLRVRPELDNMQHSVLSSNRSEMTVINSEFIDRSQGDDSKLTFTCSDGLHP